MVESVLLLVVVAPLLWLELLDAARNGSEGVGRMCRVYVAVRHINAML